MTWWDDDDPWDEFEEAFAKPCATDRRGDPIQWAAMNTTGSAIVLDWPWLSPRPIHVLPGDTVVIGFAETPSSMDALAEFRALFAEHGITAYYARNP